MHPFTIRFTQFAALLPRLCLLFACLTIAPAHGLDPTVRLADYHHTTWSAKEGAPPRITTMAQTQDGWLWLGTPSGLYRFDGVTFAKFVAVDGSTPLDDTVSNLYAMDNGDLLIGYLTGGLDLLRHDKLLPLRSRDDIPASYQAEVDIDGSLWIAALRGLHRYHAGAWTTFGADQGFPGTDAKTVTLDHYGRLWTSDGDHLYLLDRERGRFVRQAPGGANAIVPSPDGQVWRGIDGQWQVLPLPENTARIPVAAWRAPSASAGGLFDRHGNHWALRCPVGVCRTPAPRLGGIDRFEADALATERLDQPWQLSNLSANVIFEDREGNIWVGTQAGLERFRHNKLVAVPLPAGESWFEVFADQDGRALLRSMPNAYLFEAGATAFAKLPQPAQIATGWDGGLLRSDTEGITHSLDGKTTFTAYPRGADGEPVGKRPMLLAGDREELWLTFPGKGLFHYRQGKWTAAASYGLPRGMLGLSRAPDGAAWIGYRDGSVMRVQEGRASRFNEGDHSGFGAVVFIDARDGIVLGAEGGIAVLEHGRIHKLRSADPEALAGVSGQILGAGGERWFNGRRGAVHVTAEAWARALAAPDGLLEVRVLDHLDGYPGSAIALPTLSTARRTRDGRLWFAGNSGVAYLDPARVHRNAIAPQVVIAPLDVAGARRREDGAMLLPPDTTRLRVDYTALSYAMPERVRFRYRLDGVDDEWQEAGARRMAFYTRLDPGAYRFRVVAFNEDGVPSEHETSLAFEIEPTLVQTRWFSALCALALTLLAFGIFRWRTRLLARRYAERYRERLAERERIARALHDSLLQSVQGLVLRLNTVVMRMSGDSAARTHIEAILDHADTVMAEAREELADLRAQPAKPEQDLGQALASFGRTLQAECGPHFSLQVDGAPRALASVSWHEIYNIGREALFNAYRHADARRIEVVIDYGARQFSLVVRDDGRGIDPAIRCAGGREGHWGLAGMRERALALGGTLELDSPRSEGTEIALRIPADKAYRPLPRRGLGQRLHDLRRRLMGG